MLALFGWIVIFVVVLVVFVWSVLAMIGMRMLSGRWPDLKDPEEWFLLVIMASACYATYAVWINKPFTFILGG